MQITMQESIGSRGATVLYAPTFTISQDEQTLSWGTFDFLTISATTTIQAGSIDISRDEQLDRKKLIIFRNGELEILTILGDAEFTPLEVGDGDIIGNVWIPCDTAQEIMVTYKNVIEEEEVET